MFMWDESTPKTLSASPTNQLKVSLGVRAATLCTIEILAVMDMVIFRMIFFELLVFFTFTLLTLHSVY